MLHLPQLSSAFLASLTVNFKLIFIFSPNILLCICLTSLTRAKCGTRSTLCWKVGNISGSTELFAL